VKEEVVRSPEFYDRVTAGGGAETENLFELLEEKGIRYCVVGGQAVNHYVEPLVRACLVIHVYYLASKHLDRRRGWRDHGPTGKARAKAERPGHAGR
jgi:hypothetical protein